MQGRLVSDAELPARLDPETTTTPSGRVRPRIARVKSRDLRRANAFNRFVLDGADSLTAWRKVLTGPWGFPTTRGQTLTDERVRMSLLKFQEHVAPHEIAETRAICGTTLRRAAVKASGVVEKIIDGDFGVGTAVLDDETGERVAVKIDAEGARVRLAASKLALEATGVVNRGGGKGPMRVNVAGNAAFNSFGDFLRSPLPEST